MRSGAATSRGTLAGLRLAVVLGMLLGTGCTSRPALDHAALDELLGQMKDRLVLMHDVARWKWNTRQPIPDPAREEAFLRGMMERGRDHGLDPELTRAFFQAQIEAAKAIQQADFTRWEREKPVPFTDVPDLSREVRPRIDAISQGMLLALARLRPLPGETVVRSRAAVILTGEGIDDEVRTRAIRPLLQGTASDRP